MIVYPYSIEENCHQYPIPNAPNNEIFLDELSWITSFHFILFQGTKSPIPILLEDLNETQNESENQCDSLLAEDEGKQLNQPFDNYAKIINYFLCLSSELELVDNCDVVANDVAESFYTVINSILRVLDLIITDVDPSELLIDSDATSSGEENVSDDSGKCSGLNDGFLDFTN